MRNVPHNLKHLNIIPSRQYSGGRFSECSLAGLSLSLGMAFVFKSLEPLLVPLICFVLMVQDVSPCLLLQRPSLMLASMLLCSDGLLPL